MAKKKEYTITYSENNKGDFTIIADGDESKYKKKAKLNVEFEFLLVAASLIENITHTLCNNKIQERDLIKSILKRVQILKENRIVIK